MDKKRFVGCFFDAYVHMYINNNVHCLHEFYRALKVMTKTRDEDVLWEQYERMRMLLHANEFEALSIEHEKHDVKRLVGLVSKKVSLFDAVKERVGDEVYACLHYVYQCIVEQRDYDQAASCVAAMLEVKKWEDSLLILMNLFMYLAKNGNHDMYKYVAIVRDLLYFKSTKKVLKTRFKLVYVCLHVLIHGVRTDKLRKKSHGHMAYLFAICPYDYRTQKELESIRSSLRHERSSSRDLILPYNEEDVKSPISKII